MLLTTLSAYFMVVGKSDNVSSHEHNLEISTIRSLLIEAGIFQPGEGCFLLTLTIFLVSLQFFLFIIQPFVVYIHG